MKVQGLDGRRHSWNLIGYRTPSENCSSHHLRARELLTQLFPFDLRLEEVSLPGTNGLTADFYLPERKLLVEVHGEQHYKQVNHFHKNIAGFWNSNRRDQRKEEWCEINNLKYVCLPHFESEDQWKARLTSSPSSPS